MTKFSQIATTGSNLVSTDFLMGVQSGTTDVLFTPAQVGNGIPASAPLTGTGATITANAPLINVSQTWNTSAATFQGAVINITNTLSQSGSLSLDIQLAGASHLRHDITSDTLTLDAQGRATNPT